MSENWKWKLGNKLLKREYIVLVEHSMVEIHRVYMIGDDPCLHNGKAYHRLGKPRHGGGMSGDIGMDWKPLTNGMKLYYGSFNDKLKGATQHE